MMEMTILVWTFWKKTSNKNLMRATYIRVQNVTRFSQDQMFLESIIETNMKTRGPTNAMNVTKPTTAKII